MNKCKILIKTISIFMVVIFSFQCAVISKGALIDVEKKVDENPALGYNYKFEPVPATESNRSTLEFKFVKVPRNRIDSVKTYNKIKRLSSESKALIGTGIGFASGILLAIATKPDFDLYQPNRKVALGILGGIIGLAVGTLSKPHETVLGKIQEKETVYTDKTNVIAIPLANQPIEIEFVNNSTDNTYKMDIRTIKKFTDNDGKITIDIKNDFGFNKIPSKKYYTMSFTYINAETGLRETIKEN